MKSSIAYLLAIFTVATAHAGSFGGPPPFSNGFPTGIDGSYQASARGTNLSGVIRFYFSGGSQSLGTTTLTAGTAEIGKNSWAIFYEGKLYKGLTEANINQADITGILSSVSAVPTAINNLQTTTGLGMITDPAPKIWEIVGQNLSGSFTAKLSQKSSIGTFKGDGQLEVTLPPLYVYNLDTLNTGNTTISAPGAPTAPTYAQDPNTGQAQSWTETSSQGVPDPSNPAASGYGHLTSATFKVSGTRNSTQ